MVHTIWTRTLYRDPVLSNLVFTEYKEIGPIQGRKNARPSASIEPLPSDQSLVQKVSDSSPANCASNLNQQAVHA